MARPPRSHDAARKRRSAGRPAKPAAAMSAATRPAGAKPAGTRRKRPATPQPLEHRLLLTAILCLLAGGAVMVYSASSARTLLEHGGDGTSYLVKYLAY